MGRRKRPQKPEVRIVPAPDTPEGEARLGNVLRWLFEVGSEMDEEQRTAEAADAKDVLTRIDVRRETGSSHQRRTKQQ